MGRKGKIINIQKRDEIERPVRYRTYKQFFLIVCEDEKTEPTYFEQFTNQFPEKTMFLKTVGTGRSPKGVVEQAIKERDNIKAEALKDIDFVWAVFDKDDADENETKIQNFEDAFNVAEREKIEVAYSNEVFELWLLLHFKDIDSTVAIPRQEIYKELELSVKACKNYENFVYQHGKSDILDVLAIIGNENDALRRAEQMLEQQKTKKPIEANPSTKVFLLVKELRDWINYYNYIP